MDHQANAERVLRIVTLAMGESEAASGAAIARECDGLASMDMLGTICSLAALMAAFVNGAAGTLGVDSEFLWQQFTATVADDLNAL
jgi:hypothetical protein